MTKQNTPEGATHWVPPTTPSDSTLYYKQKGSQWYLYLPNDTWSPVDKPSVVFSLKPPVPDSLPPAMPASATHYRQTDDGPKFYRLNGNSTERLANSTDRLAEEVWYHCLRPNNLTPIEQVIATGDGEATEYPVKLSKYHREIKPGVYVDVYDVLKAFDPENRNAADDHAIKKMLLPGKRGAKDGIQDRREAIQALERAIQWENGDE